MASLFHSGAVGLGLAIWLVAGCTIRGPADSLGEGGGVGSDYEGPTAGPTSDTTSVGQGGYAGPTSGTGASGGAGAGSGSSASSSSSSGSSTSSSSSSGTGGGVQVVPPLGGSSQGSGGPTGLQGDLVQAGGVVFRVIIPASLKKPAPLLIVFSGTEGGKTMTQNLLSVAPLTGTGDFIRAVLDGTQYFGNGAAGATVLDDLRASYDVDNDRTYLLGESAGTSAALQLGLSLRQSYFAAYWANDVNAVATPALSSAELGFAPWGQAGPGGQTATAKAIIDGMSGAGYQLPSPAPYAGPGANKHGSGEQFISAMSWFAGKNR